MAVARPMPELAPVTTETGASLMAPTVRAGRPSPGQRTSLWAARWRIRQLFALAPRMWAPARKVGGTGRAASADDALAEGGDPVVGAAPAGVGVLAGAGRPGAGCGIGAEELHRPLLGVQLPQGVGHQLVVDVGLGVDHEAVVAEPTALGGAADQVRQVDPPGGELLEDRDQAAGLVGPLVHDHRRAVVARRGRDAVAGDEHEPGL